MNSNQQPSEISSRPRYNRSHGRGQHGRGRQEYRPSHMRSGGGQSTGIAKEPIRQVEGGPQPQGPTQAPVGSDSVAQRQPAASSPAYPYPPPPAQGSFAPPAAQAGSKVPGPAQGKDFVVSPPHQQLVAGGPNRRSSDGSAPTPPNLPIQTLPSTATPLTGSGTPSKDSVVKMPHSMSDLEDQMLAQADLSSSRRMLGEGDLNAIRSSLAVNLASRQQLEEQLLSFLNVLAKEAERYAQHRDHERQLQNLADQERADKEDALKKVEELQEQLNSEMKVAASEKKRVQDLEASVKAREQTVDQLEAQVKDLTHRLQVTLQEKEQQVEASEKRLSQQTEELEALRNMEATFKTESAQRQFKESELLAQLQHWKDLFERCEGDKRNMEAYYQRQVAHEQALRYTLEQNLQARGGPPPNVPNIHMPFSGPAHPPRPLQHPTSHPVYLPAPLSHSLPIPQPHLGPLMNGASGVRGPPNAGPWAPGSGAVNRPPPPGFFHEGQDMEERKPLGTRNQGPWGEGMAKEPTARVLSEEQMVEVFSSVLKHYPNKAWPFTSDLEAALQAALGPLSWDAHYKLRYGTMQDFIHSHPHILSQLTEGAAYRKELEGVVGAARGAGGDNHDEAQERKGSGGAGSEKMTPEQLPGWTSTGAFPPGDPPALSPSDSVVVPISLPGHPPSPWGPPPVLNLIKAPPNGQEAPQPPADVEMAKPKPPQPPPTNLPGAPLSSGSTSGVHQFFPPPIGRPPHLPFSPQEVVVTPFAPSYRGPPLLPSYKAPAPPLSQTMTPMGQS